MASENLLSVYTSLQNNLKAVIADEEALLASLQVNSDVPQTDIDNLEGIIQTSKNMLSQVDGLISHMNDIPSGDIPLVHGIEPDTGSVLGGEALIIDGHNFLGVTKLTFGLVPCLDFSVLDDSTIDATAPKSNVLGDVTVYATNAAGTSLAEGDEVAATFNYFDPNETEKEDTSFVDGLKAGVGR